MRVQVEGCRFQVASFKLQVGSREFEPLRTVVTNLQPSTCNLQRLKPRLAHDSLMICVVPFRLQVASFMLHVAHRAFEPLRTIVANLQPATCNLQLVKPRLVTIAFVLLLCGAFSRAFAADWLIDPTPFSSRITTDSSGKKIGLNNGLV